MRVLLVLLGLLYALVWVNGLQEFALNATFPMTGSDWRLALRGSLVQGNVIMVTDAPSSPEYALKAALSPTFSQTSSVQVSTGEFFYFSCSDDNYAYFGRWYTGIIGSRM